MKKAENQEGGGGKKINIKFNIHPWYSLKSTFCVQSKTQTVALTPIPLPGLRMAYMFLYMNYIAYCQK